MLAHQSRTPRTARAVASAVLLAGLTVAGLTVSAGDGLAAAAPTASRLVSYQGYRFEIPASWPVISLSAHPRDCVRFDQHVVYLGAAGADESCPSWLLGTTEALIIQPAAADTARTSVENPVDREITTTAPRISLTATFDTDPTIIYRIIASSSLPAPVISVPNPARLATTVSRQAAASRQVAGSRPAAGSRPVAGSPAAAAARTPSAGAGELAEAAAPAALVTAPAGPASRVAAPQLPAAVANYRGLGFDACAAPSASYMQAWQRHSPYDAVGIYIGGADRACDQANLTPAWVSAQAAAGWHFFPMYAGPQAVFRQLTAPASQGTAAAADAVSRAADLGFGPQTPIYYDMEAYPASATGVALRFLSAWTTELHKLGYRSGVYSSSQSGVIDLARQYFRHQFAMPDVIYDALWNGSANTADSVLRAGEWAAGQRLHQYSGNVVQTYGGDPIDIDQDDLDVALPVAGGTSQAAPAIAVPQRGTAVFYAGADHRLWRNDSVGSGWSAPVYMGSVITSAPSVVTVGTARLDVFYRGAGGHLWSVTRTSRGWGKPSALPRMGIIGGQPVAVARPDGLVDVFWKGSHDDHLWVGQFAPSTGWTGPQDLGGSLASTPSPVDTTAGETEVFFQGSNGNLWRVARPVGGGWSRPADIGMGILGGQAQAVALLSGAVDVFWRGSTSPHYVWAAFLVPGRAIRGPVRLNGSISLSPWPVAAAGTAGIFFRGTDGGLWVIPGHSGGGWAAPVRMHMGGLTAGPFAAVGTGTNAYEVFWRGPGGRLRAARLSGDRWTGPQNLHGRVS